MEIYSYIVGSKDKKKTLKDISSAFINYFIPSDSWISVVLWFVSRLSSLTMTQVLTWKARVPCKNEIRVRIAKYVTRRLMDKTNASASAYSCTRQTLEYALPRKMIGFTMWQGNFNRKKLIKCQTVKIKQRSTDLQIYRYIVNIS